MNQYPRIVINKDKLRNNVKYLKKLCNSHGIKISAVTKVFCCDPIISNIYIKEGIKTIADSRLENLAKIESNLVTKMLLRIPMLSEIKRVSEIADVTLISEIKVIRALNKITQKIFGIIIMIDLGDLREGIFSKEELFNVVSEVLTLKNINLIGFGTNLSCYGGILPTKENMNQLVTIVKEVESKFNINVEIISGGNSGVLSIIDILPKRINQLRMGASLACGIGLNDIPLKGTSQSAFTLEAEVVEVKTKVSIPIGKRGLDAFGNTPVFEDKGNIIRAICAIGKQDVAVGDLIPIEKGIEILGASSDHLILNVTDSPKLINVGDIIRFKLGYGGTLSLMTSPYVHKSYK